MPSLLIPRHSVRNRPDGLSPLQHALIHDPHPIRICSAPTGSGKTYAFVKAALAGDNILFMVPTRRLAQNIRDAIVQEFQKSGHMTPEDAQRHVAMWTSDSRAQDQAQGLTSMQIRHKRLQEMQQTGQALPEKGSFLIATPESIAYYLAGEAGQYGFSAEDKASITDILQRDHIVCDEFHTIDVRGYGIAVAVAAIVHKQAATQGHHTKLSFLSATPVDILPVLNACDVPPTAIIQLEEEVTSYTPNPDIAEKSSALQTVLSIPAPPVCPQERWVHGDVRLELDCESTSMVAMLEQHPDLIKAALATPGEQIIVIYDTITAMNAERAPMLEAFQKFGLTNQDIHRISSIDDSIDKAEEQHGISGHTLDPQKTKVIIATASVEMGVTLNSRLMFIEPGHSLASCVQRIGRVARKDKNGVMLIRAHPDCIKRAPWFSSVQALFQTAETDSTLIPTINIDDAVQHMLASLRASFLVKTKDAFSEKITTFSAIPVRAAWCAGLFWSSMCSRYHLHAGHKDTYKTHAFQKARTIYHLLRSIKQASPHKNSPQERWVDAFLKEALVLRVMEPRVYIKDPIGTRSIPWNHFARNDYLLTLPVLISMEGDFHIECPIPLGEALDKPRARQAATLVYDMLMPHSVITHQTDSRMELHTWARSIKQEMQSSKIDDEDFEVLDMANKLVLWTGIVPKAQSDGMGLQGPKSGVL